MCLKLTKKKHASCKETILGRSSSKTTEIYTYASTKSIQQIKSPFDDL
jgi:integrase/recombinase XerD